MDIIEKERIISLAEAIGIMTDERQVGNLSFAFAPDAELHLPYEEHFRGRDDVMRAYQDFWNAWKSSHHLLGQCIVTSISGDYAEGMGYCLLTCRQADKQQTQWGLIYRDVYHMVDGEWYIRSRRVEVVWER